MNTKLVSRCSAKKMDNGVNIYSSGEEQSFLGTAVNVLASKVEYYAFLLLLAITAVASGRGAPLKTFS